MNRKTPLMLIPFILLLPVLVSCMTYTYAEASKAIPVGPSGEGSSLPETRYAVLQQVEPTSFAEKAIPVGEEVSAVSLLRAALIPLPCDAEPVLLDAILNVAMASELDVWAFTGDARSIAYVDDNSPVQGIMFGTDRFVVTSREILAVSDSSVRIAADGNRTVGIAVVNLQESTAFDILRRTEDVSLWKPLIDAVHETRIKAVQPLLGAHDMPLLVLASLGEPSAEDWFDTASDHPYRTPIAWPLLDALQESDFLDSWRMTHFNAVSDPGTTWELHDESALFSERVDFLLAKGLLPMETSTVLVGPAKQERLPHEQRWAVTGTFLIP